MGPYCLLGKHFLVYVDVDLLVTIIILGTATRNIVLCKKNWFSFMCVLSPFENVVLLDSTCFHLTKEEPILFSC
jgi:hypothetical protein